MTFVPQDLHGYGVVVDVDGTISEDDTALGYHERRPNVEVIDRLNWLHQRGVKIIIYTARNMRTYDGNIGLINLNTLPVLLSWLRRHGVRHDEVHVAKPWCGPDGLYVRENAIRPSDFVELDLDALVDLVKHSRALPVDH